MANSINTLTKLYSGHRIPGLITIPPKIMDYNFTKVFVSDNARLAAALSFHWSPEMGIGLHLENGIMIMMIPKNLKYLLQQPCSVYEVLVDDEKNIKHLDITGEYEVTGLVLVHKEWRYPNVLKAFEEYGIKIIFS